MNTLERITAIRTGGGVERCHGIRHQGSYSVAAHTWGILTLIYALWPGDFPRLAASVLFHDVPEAWTGDIPAPTKRYNGAVRAAIASMEDTILARLKLPNVDDLCLHDLARVKAADRLELYFWAKEQQAEGNRHAETVLRELDTFFAEEPLPEPADQLYMAVRDYDVVHHTDGVIREINT